MIKKHNFYFSPCLFVFLALFVYIQNTLGQVSNPNSSVLATGNFYKLKVERSGLYKINKSITDKLGLSANFDLKKLKVFTNYGGHIPEEIAKSNPSDLVEVPLLVNDNNSNNLLDGADEIYFYSEGPNKWFYDQGKKRWTHNTNIYDVNNYVFVTADGGDGKRIAEKNYLVDATYNTSSYDQLQIFNEDRFNLLTREVNTQGSGKQWFGEYFKGGDKKTFTNKFNTTIFLPNTPVVVTGLFAARSPQRGSGVLSIGNQTLSYSTNSLNVNDFEISYASQGKIAGVVNEIKSDDAINLSFNTVSPIGEGWLDFIQLEGRSALKYNESQFEFSDGKALTQGTNYTFEGNTAGLLVWDVTKLDAISSLKLTNNTFSYPEKNDISRFIAFKTKDAYEPTPIGLIKNQNLHAITEADMVIVYPNILKDEVLRLAKHRSEYENLKVITVEIQEIYNEFSSGRKDVSALRNFAKMLFNRDPSFKYLLLFGDATYDYRFLMNKEEDIAYIPVYETDESLNPITGFPTDDYFALLSDNEGGNLVGALDIAVGRLPVKNLKEAKDVVSKIMAYDLDPERFGDWRLSMGFTADDEDYNTHIVQADRISKKVNDLNPEINIKKMYFDVYEQVSTPGGERFPDATLDIANQVFKGLLTLCYLGHGGPSGLSQERVLQINDIKNWDNKKKPLVFITATCSLTGFDNPSFVTTGEETMLMPEGGAIALFSTVRSVYSSENERLTNSVFDFIYQKENGLPLRFGDILVRAKNNQASDTLRDNARKFALIGDPAQRIGLPANRVKLNSINDVPVAIFDDTLSALDAIVLKGEVVDNAGNVLKSFDGNLTVTFYDKQSIRETLANDDESYKYKFDEFRNVIFKGGATVQDGKFSISFVVPKDINYELGAGKLSFYATDGKNDAGGYVDGPFVGGDIKNNIIDNKAPIVKVFINDTSFVEGGVTNENPILLVDLKDDFGINVTGNSIGHDLVANLTGPIRGTYILNDYYVSNLNDPASGRVEFPFSNLPAGTYEVSVKAWDISNNSAVSKTTFVIKESGLDKLLNVYNYPNPFNNQTNFSFEHDFNGSNIDIELLVYATTGALVKQIKVNKFATGSRESTIDWSGKADFGNELAPGVYFYKIKVKNSALGLERESNFEKLVKL